MCNSVKNKNFVQLEKFVICLEDISSIRDYENSDEKKRIMFNNGTRDIIVSNAEAEFVREYMQKYANSFNTFVEIGTYI